MARQRKNYQARYATGTVVPFPIITVYLSGTLNLALIFSDDIGAGTPRANPFTGDVNGNFWFYASDGAYDINIVGTGINYALGAENFVFQGAVATTGIISLNTLIDANQTMVPGSAGTDFTISSLAGIHTFDIPTMGGVGITRGLINSADYAAILSRIISLNGQLNVYQSFALGTAGFSPAWISALGVHTLNIPVIGAVGVTTGLLNSADYATFTAKQSPLPVGGTTLQYLRGDLSIATLSTLVVPENTNLYYTDARVRAALSVIPPLSYNSSTGSFSIPQATSVVNGFLAAGDWSTFNAKLNSLNGSSQLAQTFVVGTAGTDFAISTNVGAGTHTFNLPDASAANRGAITTGTQTIAGAKTFSGTLINSGGRKKGLRIATTTPVAVAVTDGIVVTKLAAPGAVAVNLPAGVLGQIFTIKDGLGDATANNITITPAAGTIDGSGTAQIASNYGSRTLIYNGTEWNIV